MTRQEFQELRSLINENTTELKSLIKRNYEMIGLMYERLTRVEVGQEQLSRDLRAVADGVTGNAE